MMAQDLLYWHAGMELFYSAFWILDSGFPLFLYERPPH